MANRKSKIIFLSTENYINLLSRAYMLLGKSFGIYFSLRRTCYMQEIIDVKVYPVEVLPGYLYLATFKQAQDDMINKHLKSKGHINVTTRTDTR